MKARILMIPALMVLGTTVTLAADPPKFKIFGGAAFVSPLGEEDVDIGQVRDSIQASNELGWTVGFEARVNKGIGLEFDYINVTNDIEFGNRTITNVDLDPISFTLNFHLIPTRVVDFYIGPTVSYFIWGDLDLGNGRVSADNELDFGASAGLEIGGEHFAFLGGLRWVAADLSPSGGPSIKVDPLISRLGVAFKW